MRQRCNAVVGLNAKTYIDILSEQLIGHAVFLEDVVVGAVGSDGGAEEEAEEAVDPSLARIHSQINSYKRPKATRVSSQTVAGK